MIEKRQIEKLAAAQQTTMDNLAREYFQHLFLAQLYQEKGADALLFKGGTALRIVWQSPRFSEDLDFTGIQLSNKIIEGMMEGALVKMEKEGIGSEIEESKKTSGGYLAVFHFKTEEYESRIQIEVSLRKDRKAKGSAVLISPELVPPYTLAHLQESSLVGEKIQASLTRGKARDFYDLYFILRARLAFQDFFVKDKTLKSKILKIVKSGKLDFKRELKEFLPVSQHMIIKGFPEILISEIERNLPG
jgi:predicted nucleotidyltransferase component of viral defense system